MRELAGSVEVIGEWRAWNGADRGRGWASGGRGRFQGGGAEFVEHVEGAARELACDRHDARVWLSPRALSAR